MQNIATTLIKDRYWPQAGHVLRWASNSVGLLLIVHVATWTLYGVMALGVGTLHDDMIEAWNWSQKPQLGYYKHPPLMAWVVWIWFSVLPVADWSYYLLAAVNSAIGLAGVAALSTFFRLKAYRSTAVALMMLTPLYGILALKYNANAVLIPLWPWATYALLRSLETRSAAYGLLAGGLMGLSLLGKYYSLLLGIALFCVTLLPIWRRAYYRSAAPYVALLAAIAVFTPHAVWTVEQGFPSLQYAMSKFNFPFSRIVAWAGMTALAPLIFLPLPLLLACRASPPEIVAWGRALVYGLSAPRNRALAIVAILPFLLTLGFGFVGRAKVSLSYTIPIFFLGSLLILVAVPVRVRRRVRVTAPCAVAIISCCIVATAPLVGAWRSQSSKEVVNMPLSEVAIEATRVWRQATGKALGIVGSTDRFFGAISFYSPDHPLFFVNLNLSHAMWLDDAKLQAEGFMLVCVTGHTHCENTSRVGELANSERVMVRLQNRAGTSPAIHFTLTLVMPGQWRR